MITSSLSQGLPAWPAEVKPHMQHIKQKPSKFPSTFSKVSLRRKASFHGKNREKTNTSKGRTTWESSSYQLGRSLTRASIIKALYTGDPAAPVLWQHWDSMHYRTVSLPRCQQHQFSLNPRLTSKRRRSQTRVQKTWKVKLRTSTKNPSTYPLSHLSNGYLGGLFATVTVPVRPASDGKITGLILAATAVLVLSQETEPALPHFRFDKIFCQLEAQVWNTSLKHLQPELRAPG